MKLIQWISLAAAILCIMSLLVLFFRLAFKGFPKDLAKAQGSKAKGITYAHTVAMMPSHKESAFKHLPTYTAGIIYHLGTFLSLLLYVGFICCTLIDVQIPQTFAYILSACLLISTLCGFFILGKRIIKQDLRHLSTPDDYISNALVTLFQLMGALLLLQIAENGYYLLSTLLFLWIPLGKIRHLLYYFLARTHLGIFYGSRGTWPLAK